MDRAEGRSKLPTSLHEVDDYYSSDSSSPSLKQAFQSEIEVESTGTIVMPIMTICINNLEEEMATIKAMLERPIKESEQKEVRINLQEEKIASLIRKLQKRPAPSSSKGLESEKEEKTSIQSEAFDERVHSKKGNKLKKGESPKCNDRRTKSNTWL